MSLFLPSKFISNKVGGAFFSVGATVGVKLLATTHTDKHMANVLSNLLLVMRWQRLEILVTDITEVNPVSLCLSLFPSNNYINSPQTHP